MKSQRTTRVRMETVELGRGSNRVYGVGGRLRSQRVQTRTKSGIKVWAIRLEWGESTVTGCGEISEGN